MWDRPLACHVTGRRPVPQSVLLVALTSWVTIAAAVGVCQLLTASAFGQRGGPEPPTGVAANGYAHRNDIVWKPVSVAGLQGYNVHRSESESGPFAKLNTSPLTDAG